MVKFSKCCNPLPGDQIIGFVTRGYGVSIHKVDCVNVPVTYSDKEQASRWVRSEWAKSIKETFRSSVEILGSNRSGLLADLSVMLNNLRIPVHSFSAKELKDGRVSFKVTMDLSDVSQLSFVITQINRIQGILSIERIAG